MRRACITVVVLLTVLASFADAGREDDFDFAQGLVERKFYDLAEEQFQAIIDDRTRPPEQQAAGELGLALLHKAKATDAMGDSDREAKEVLDLFDRAEDRFDQFLAGYPNHPKRITAKFEVGNLLQSKGTYITNRLDKEPEETVEELKKTAETSFEQAIDLFREVAQILEDQAEEGSQEDWNSRRARFFEAVAHYYKGLLYEAGGAERQGVLDRAATLLEDFVWSNEENILGGYAYLYWGLAKKAADQPSEAFDYLSVAASNYQVPDPDENAPGFRIWTDLFLQAYFKMGEYGNELGEVGETDYRETGVEHARQMIERIPRVEDRKWGHFALLEYSRALMGLGRFEEAMDVAVQVSKRGEELGATTEWGEATAFMALSTVSSTCVLSASSCFFRTSSSR